MQQKKQTKLKAGLNSEQTVLLIRIESESKLTDRDIIRSLSTYLSKGWGIPDLPSEWTLENCTG